MKRPIHLLLLLSLLTTSLASAAKYESPESLEGARRVVYKTVGDVELALYVFEPEGHQPSDRRAAAVFFFGGGWQGGTVKQFASHCRYLASRGMVGIVADYRVKSRHQTTPFESVQDARSAVRWIRAAAPRLGIDPDRIAAGGGSAGGHIAAATATTEGINEASDDLQISARPDALVLFNPVYDNGPDGYGHKQFGERYQEISPLHNIREGMPPTIVFLGTRDGLIPVSTAERFQQRMKDVGARSELFLYEGQPHGFFNHTSFRKQAIPLYYYQTALEMDRFLASLGFLEGPPTLVPPQYAFESTDEFLDVLHAGRPIARYMIAYEMSTPEQRHATYKPFLHVFDKAGENPITNGPGGQYPHHRGIFLGFSRTQSGGKSYDFWHMKNCTQRHRGFITRQADEQGATFTSEIAWQDEAGEPVLIEQRTFKFLPPPDRSYALIEMHSRLTATAGDVVLDGDPEHAGAQFRPASEIVAAETKYHFHADGVDPLQDRDLLWVGETFRIPSGKYSVVILNHPENPQGTRFSAYRDYGRFGAFPVLEIAEGETAELRYRWIISGGKMLPAEVIDQARQNFIAGD